MIQKICSKCDVTKLLSEFYKQKNGRYGRKAICKECYNSPSNSAKKRQILITSVPNKLRDRQAETIRKHFNYECALTGKEDNIGLDHFIPVSWGNIVNKYGIGGTTYANMIPLHRSINSSKNSNHPFIWFEKKGKGYNISTTKWNEIVDYIAKKHGMTTTDYINTVNACFSEIVAMRWSSSINRYIDNHGIITPTHIRNALKANLNIPVVLSLFGSNSTKKLFNDLDTISLINEVKETFIKKEF